ncbi:hypothetical protein [Bacillus subtilis]|uniref:hypothetical protein n=1 Tax=Bacillus subtilis TaxID=1423 RepID=UPI0007AFA082|nr:hypothetical protein [Bacillus subtilis]WMW42120.1 hypothetical protein RFN65_14545 [Bacillus subtilis]
MGQTKRNCHWVPIQPANFRLSKVHPDWEMHSDWIMALEHLDAYNHWVSEIVLPIAFQWIEENKEDVYKDIPSDEIDDVGIVISKAFELIREKEAYQKGLEEYKKYEKDLKEESLDTKKINPVWSSLTKELRESRLSIKKKYSSKFKSAIPEHKVDD